MVCNFIPKSDFQIETIKWRVQSPEQTAFQGEIEAKIQQG